VLAGCPLALEADPLAVLDPGRDARRDRAVGQPATRPVTGRADLVVHQLAAVALRTGLVHREPATHGVDHDARAVTRGAHVWSGAGLAARSRARRARSVRAQPEADRGAFHRVGE